MLIKKRSVLVDGNIRTEYFSCPCGKGTITSEYDSTQGFKDWFTTINCPECNKKYYVSNPDGPN